MPPLISFSKKDILQAAVEVVRRRGPGKITARSVAAQLGSSTQPIYRAFASIEALVQAVEARAVETALRYCQDALDEESAFLSIGLGYLKFSREEPNLFRLLVASGRATWSPTSPDWPLYDLVEKMTRDRYVSSLPEEILRKLLRDMFIYTHGLATLAAQEPSPEDLVRERELLRYVGAQLIRQAWTRMEQDDSQSAPDRP
jgi:AcrR family transcriptional regulator